MIEDDMKPELKDIPGIAIVDSEQDKQVDSNTELLAHKSQQRSRLQDPGNRVRSLKCFAEVDKMIRGGAFIRNVAHYIQDDMGELKQMSPRAVMFLLKEYKNYIYTDDSILNGEPRRQRDEDDPWYVLHSLNQRYREMEERIAMEVGTEMTLQKLFSTTHKEYHELLTMGEKILGWQDKLGLLNRERGGQKQRVGSGQAGRVDVAAIITNPESRQRIMSLVEAMVGDPKFLDNLDKVDTDKEAAKKVEESQRNKHKHKAVRVKKPKIKKPKAKPRKRRR